MFPMKCDLMSRGTMWCVSTNVSQVQYIVHSIASITSISVAIVFTFLYKDLRVLDYESIRTSITEHSTLDHQGVVYIT